MKNKTSTPTPKVTPDNDEKIDPKPKRPSVRAVAAEELANELSNVSIVEVAKIAAQLSTLEIAPFEAVDWAYTLLELSAIAKSGLKNGYGFKFPLVDSQNFPKRYGASNLRSEELNAAFPELDRADESYRVDFQEGLTKLMGKNVEVQDRPEVLRRFMEQEAGNFWGTEALNPRQIEVLLEGFKTAGFDPNFYTSLWFYYPRWRASDVRSIKAANAKRTRKARPPKTTKTDKFILEVMKHENQIGERL